MDFTKLFNEIVNQAVFFLNESGEFYPFGWVTENDSSTHSLSVYFGEDFPTSIKMIEELVRVLELKVKKDKCLNVAICINVEYTPPQGTPQNALEIRIDSKEERINYFLCYKKESDEIIFGNLYGESGTLQVYN